MTEFTVQVLDRAGMRRSLREAAPDEPTLREILRGRGLWPLRIRARKAANPARIKLPTADFIALLHQLGLQLKAGVMADAALIQIAEDAPKGPMRTMLLRIHADVSKGKPIHEACRVFPKVFPPHLAAVIEAGETSARLPEALKSLSENLKNAAELKKTARRALLYPAIVGVATLGLVAFMLGGVVPQFASIFESMHMRLPWLTRALIAASGFLRVQWPWVGGGGLGLAVTAVYFFRSARYRRLRDRLSRRIPIFGDVLVCLGTARFASHTRLLHEAGIPVLESLGTAVTLTHHAVLEEQLLLAREGVAAGKPLYAALPRDHAFPGFMIPALKAGETTGQLGAALLHLEEYAAGRAKDRLATALALLEPVMLALLTAIVGGIALSFFLPLLALLGGLNGR